MNHSKFHASKLTKANTPESEEKELEKEGEILIDDSNQENEYILHISWRELSIIQSIALIEV